MFLNDEGTCETIETFEKCREWRLNRGLYSLQCNKESLPKDADTKRQIVFRGAGKRKTQEDVGQEEKETGDTEREKKDTRSDFKKCLTLRKRDQPGDTGGKHQLVSNRPLI